MKKYSVVLCFLLIATAVLGKDFNIKDFNAVGDGTTLDTKAIQDAINAASEDGGGRVVIPEGVYLTKPIKILSNVELHLQKGAVLLATTNLVDFPHVPMKHIANTDGLPRKRSSALIYADEAKNISFTGEGTIDCNGAAFVKMKTDRNWTGWQYERKVKLNESLPRVVFLAGCSNVTVRGVVLRNPPAGWSWWIHDCDKVLIEDSNVFADVRYPNNDGFHINSCRDVIIRNCHVETGDDSIIVRANNSSLAENKVCENVVVSNCTLRSWSAAVRIGWSQDGVMRNCLFKDLKIVDSSVGISMIVPIVGNGNADYGREATRFENIVFEDIEMESIYGRPFLAHIHPDANNLKFDGFYNVCLRNVRANCAVGPLLRGRKENPIKGVRFENCQWNIFENKFDSYRRHGAASWDRRQNEENIFYIEDGK